MLFIAAGAGDLEASNNNASSRRRRPDKRLSAWSGSGDFSDGSLSSVCLKVAQSPHRVASVGGHELRSRSFGHLAAKLAWRTPRRGLSGPTSLVADEPEQEVCLSERRSPDDRLIAEHRGSAPGLPSLSPDFGV